jgi:hypothetical protein
MKGKWSGSASSRPDSHRDESNALIVMTPEEALAIARKAGRPETTASEPDFSDIPELGAPAPKAIRGKYFAAIQVRSTISLNGVGR